MSSPFTHGERRVRISNRHFDNLVAWSIEVGRATALDDTERTEVERIAGMDAQGLLWPGRGFDLDTDFPEPSQRQLWARIYLDVARGIYTRDIGEQGADHWQAQYIWAAYSVGRLFVDAVQQGGEPFIPASLDHELFGLEINHTPPTRPELADRVRP